MRRAELNPPYSVSRTSAMRERTMTGRSQRIRDQLRPRGFLQRIEQLVLGRAGDFFQNGNLELASDHGCHAEHAVGRVAQPRQPAPDHRLDAFGETEPRNVDRRSCQPATLAGGAGVSQVAQHLGRKKWVAVRAVDDELRQVRRRFRADDVRHQRFDSGDVEPAQREVRDVVLAAQRGRHGVARGCERPPISLSR